MLSHITKQLLTSLAVSVNITLKGVYIIEEALPELLGNRGNCFISWEQRSNLWGNKDNIGN